MLRINAIKIEIETQDGLYGFEQNFQKGLNIIRGDNSSGKSSLFQAILFALGLEELLGGKNEKTMQSVLKDQVEFPDSEFHKILQSQIYLEIEIHGLTAAQADGIRLVIDQSNAVTSLRNEVYDAQKGTYYPELSYDEVNNCYRTQDLALFRLDNGGTLDPDLCQHVIRVEDGEGNTLTEVNLYEFLQSVDSDKLDVTRQEALLPISITFYLFTVEVELPVWYVEDVVPGWN